MTATEMKPRMTAGLFCVCSMALQPSLYVAGWNPLPGLVVPVASGWQQPAAHRRVAQTALTRVGGPEIRAVRMSMAQSFIRTGELVEFVPGRTIDVPLFWQCSAIRSALLMRLGDVIRKTAAKRLRPIVQ